MAAAVPQVVSPYHMSVRRPLSSPRSSWILVLPLTAALGAQEVLPRITTVRAERHPVRDAVAVSPPPRLLGEPATPHDHAKHLPKLPPGVDSVAQPGSAETVPRSATGPAAPCDLVLYRDRVVKPTGAQYSLIGEPSIANVGDVNLQTGNWYAARSLDSGTTWTYLSPYTTFPARDGGFCCDQRALYVPCCASRSLGRVFQADRDASRTLSPTCAPKSRLLLPAYFAPSAA